MSLSCFAQQERTPNKSETDLKILIHAKIVWRIYMFFVEEKEEHYNITYYEICSSKKSESLYICKPDLLISEDDIRSTACSASEFKEKHKKDRTLARICNKISPDFFDLTNKQKKDILDIMAQ